MNFIKFCELEGYSDVKQLPDGTFVGLYRLLYTTALCIGLNKYGWTYRYCFESKETALIELHKLSSIRDVPSGWVARRGEFTECATD